MANKTVSNLKEVTTVSNSDVLLVETSTETLKVTKGNLLKEVNEELNAKSDANHTHDEYVTESELNSKGLATEMFVTNKIAEAQLGNDGGNMDLSGYATTEYVDQEVGKTNAQLLHTASKGELDVERQRINNFTNLAQGSTTGDAELIDGRIAVDGRIYPNIGESIRSQIKNIHGVIYSDTYDYINVTNDAVKIVDKDLSLNLVNNFVVGISGSSGYLIYDVIPGENYKVTAIGDKRDGDYPQIGLAFGGDLYSSSDSSYKLISGDYDYFLGETGTSLVKDYEVTVPVDAKKMFLSNRGGYATIKKEGRVDKFSLLNDSVLNGKKIGIIGDSIAYGYGEAGGYGKMIADRNNMILQNVAVSGATISGGMKTAGGGSIPCILDQVALLDSDCDYIILEGGFNDRGVIKDGRIELGQITAMDWYGSNSTDTFCKCFENLIHDIVLKFHSKKIMYVYHHPIQKKEDVIHDSVIGILKKWSIPYVDLSEESGGMITQFGIINTTYTVGDTVHPNKLGYEHFYVPKIESKMKLL